MNRENPGAVRFGCGTSTDRVETACLGSRTLLSGCRVGRTINVDKEPPICETEECELLLIRCETCLAANKCVINCIGCLVKVVLLALYRFKQQ